MGRGRDRRVIVDAGGDAIAQVTAHLAGRYADQPDLSSLVCSRMPRISRKPSELAADATSNETLRTSPVQLRFVTIPSTCVATSEPKVYRFTSPATVFSVVGAARVSWGIIGEFLETHLTADSSATLN